MKTMAYLTFLYSLIVMLSGMLFFTYENNLKALLLEIFSGIILFFNVFFMMKEKRESYYILGILSLLLIVSYGYDFYHVQNFFSGFLTAVSFFIFVYAVLRIFKVSDIE